jgi:hypothetical protein
MRGLITAIHLSVAGLPIALMPGIITRMPHIVRPRVPLIGARASRDPYVVGSFMVNVGSLRAPPAGQLWCGGSLSAWLNVNGTDLSRSAVRMYG